MSVIGFGFGVKKYAERMEHCSAADAHRGSKVIRTSLACALSCGYERFSQTLDMSFLGAFSERQCYTVRGAVDGMGKPRHDEGPVAGPQ